MDNEALNIESALNVQQNIGKINIICDDDFDKMFDNKIWNELLQRHRAQQDMTSREWILQSSTTTTCTTSSKTIGRTASRTTLTTTSCSTKVRWQKLFYNNVFDNNLGREEWNNDIEKNIDNKKYIERGHLQQDNIDNKTEKNKFIKNNYGNNIEKEIACNDHFDNNSE